MLLKLIFVLKSKPPEDQGTPPGRQKWKHSACWLKGSNKQLRPYCLQTAQEITSLKDTFFFFLILFASALSGAVQALSALSWLLLPIKWGLEWILQCSHPASVLSQLVWLKLLLKMACSKPASCRKGSSHAALPPQPSMSLAWEGHILSCHSCCVGKAMFVGRINSNNDGSSWL